MAKTIKKVKDTLEEGLTINVPESYYKKPFVKRMLDPSSPTIEVDGEEASVRTMSMDGKLFPTIVKQELSDGSFGLVELEPQQAYDRAIATGNFIQFDSDEQADRSSKLLSKEASTLRKEYKNNQNFIAQGGKGLGDIEFRADMEPYSGDDALNRLALELFRRGEIELKGITQDQGERPGGGVIGGYEGRNFSRLNNSLKRPLRDQNPLTKEKIMSSPSLATYIAGVSEDSDTTFDRPRGESELAAMHELRHGALRYLFNNTDLKKQKYFDNYDIDVEEDIMDMTDNKTIKDRSIPIKMNEVSKLNPKYIGRGDRFDTITKYATQALEDFNVPERTEQKKPGMLQSLFGMEQGGIMMAQQEGKLPLPMEEATSAPQGGGPKVANPATERGGPAGLGAPTGAPAPAGSSDPRDEAIKEVAQKMQSRSAPAPIPAEVPQMAPPVPPTGLAAPMEEVPMMAKGGMTDDSGMSVMIGLGAPPADYEKASEGNPPPGATKEEVADDQLVLLSEGELVVPANVVRYHGLGAYEGMRRDALMGLQDMETNGQIEYVSGGAEKADKVDDDGGIIKANQGALITNPNTSKIGTFPLTIPPGAHRFLQGTGVQGIGAVPQAASSQYVQIPGTQGMNPALNTMTGLGQPLTIAGTPKPVNPYQPVTTASSVYAPNVGSYAGDGTDDAADDSTDDSTDDGTGTDETEEERRRRLAAQNAGDGGDNPEEYTGATTVFGGTSQNGMIRGGKQYQIAYESSSKQKVPGMVGALMNMGNLDQVRLTDPTTGQSVSMSKAKYDSMKENRTDASNINFIDTLMQNQVGIDYNRTRAGAIAPFKTGLAVAGEALGFGNAPGTSVAEQNEYARSLAGSLGIDYNGQSFAEIMATPEFNAPKQGGPSPVFREDAQGNLVPDTRYGTPQGLAVPEVAFGAGSNSGVRSPLDTSVSAGPFTQPTLGLTAPTTEAGRLAQSITPAGNTVAYIPDEEARLASYAAPAGNTVAYIPDEEGRLAQSITPFGNTVAAIPNEAARLASYAAPAGNTVAAIPNEAARLASYAAPVGNTVAAIPNEAARLASYAAPVGNTVAAIPNEAARLASYAAPTRNTSAVAQMSSLGFDDGDELGDYNTRASERSRETGVGTSPTLEGVSQVGNYEYDFDTPDNQGSNMDDDAPSSSRDMSTREGRKAAADDRAQEQTGRSTSRAVTDTDGNAVTSINPDGSKSVVTSEEPSGPSAQDKIVCTEMYRQTQLDDWAKAMKIWYIYQKKYLTPLHEIGYHWLFKPYVQGMRTSSVLTNLGAFFAQKRTEHLKYILTKGKSKDSLIGNIWCKIIHPIVYMVGKIVYKK